MLCSANPRSELAYTISSEEGATAASTPSHANGYARSNTSRAPRGTASRQTPWNPSHPATTSQTSS
jgi:hypothetical protein